jgi:CRP-like cAMP-binding protein
MLPICTENSIRLPRPHFLHGGMPAFTRGDPASAVFTIRRGRISIVWVSPQHKVHPLETLGPDSLVGLPAVMGGTYSVTARAVGDCELGLIPTERVLALVTKTPLLNLAVAKMVGQELARMRAMIVHNTGRFRVAGFEPHVPRSSIHPR